MTYAELLKAGRNGTPVKREDAIKAIEEEGFVFHPFGNEREYCKHELSDLGDTIWQFKDKEALRIPGGSAFRDITVTLTD